MCGLANKLCFPQVSSSRIFHNLTTRRKWHIDATGQLSHRGALAVQIKAAKSSTARFSRRDVGRGYTAAMFWARILSVLGRVLWLLIPKNRDITRITFVSMGTAGW